MKYSILLGTFGSLKPEQQEAIILHEVDTMLPKLKAIDLPVTADGLRQSIGRDAAAPSVTLVNPATDLPEAWIRYTRGEESLFIKSIQVGPHAFALRPLLRAALPALGAEQAPTIVSVVQGGNDASLSLHRKLGFRIEKELPRATRFAIEREELLERIVALAAPKGA
jgi:hypothetical protein